MPSDLSSDEAREEGNLLIEAVSLLVQRQRETETWVAEQVWQAEERVAATERRHTDLEARLARIEDELTRLGREMAPRAEPAVDERLVRLRQQVEVLKSASDARSARPAPAPAAPASPSALPPREAAPPPREAALPPREYAPPPAAGRPPASVWDLLGAKPGERWGVVLMGLGVFAVLFAVLTQLRF